MFAFGVIWNTLVERDLRTSLLCAAVAAAQTLFDACAAAAATQALDEAAG